MLRELATAFQTVEVAISDNIEANALITSTLKKLGIANVISESNSRRHREILLRIGADRVILPKEESGYQLADVLSIPGMLERLHLSQDYTLIEIKPLQGLIGKGIEVCDSFEVIVVLILRGDELILNPDQSTQFLPEDILVLVGEKRRLADPTDQPFHPRPVPYRSGIGFSTSGKLVLAGVSPALRDQLQRTRMLSLIGEENIFLATQTIGEASNAALRAATNWLAESSVEGEKGEEK